MLGYIHENSDPGPLELIFPVGRWDHRKGKGPERGVTSKAKGSNTKEEPR